MLIIFMKNMILEKLPEYENVVYEQILAECGAEDFDTFIKEEIDQFTCRNDL